MQKGIVCKVYDDNVCKKNNKSCSDDIKIRLIIDYECCSE